MGHSQCKEFLRCVYSGRGGIAEGKGEILVILKMEKNPPKGGDRGGKGKYRILSLEKVSDRV